jgi:hypothetical protein
MMVMEERKGRSRVEIKVVKNGKMAEGGAHIYSVHRMENGVQGEMEEKKVTVTVSKGKAAEIKLAHQVR